MLLTHTTSGLPVTKHGNKNALSAVCFALLSQLVVHCMWSAIFMSYFRTTRSGDRHRKHPTRDLTFLCVHTHLRARVYIKKY